MMLFHEYNDPLDNPRGHFYDKEDLASNKTYLFYLSFKLNKKPR